jgi:CRISPR/Cas system-associated endoribonuclease Cas2
VPQLIGKEKDSVVVYAVSNPSWLEKKVWGREKGSTGNVL